MSKRRDTRTSSTALASDAALLDAGGWRIEFALNPVPFKRHAGHGARAYTPPASAQFRDDFRWLLNGLRPPARPRRPLEMDLALTIDFWRHVERGPAGDIDNMAKAVLDAGNGHLWVDDRIIRATSLRLVESGPRVAGLIVVKIRAFA